MELQHVCVLKSKFFLMQSGLRTPVLFHSSPWLPQKVLLRRITGLVMTYFNVLGNPAFQISSNITHKKNLFKNSVCANKENIKAESNS